MGHRTMLGFIAPGFIAAVGFSLAASGQSAPALPPIPADPLEIVTGQTQVVDTPAGLDEVLQLLARARNSYGLRDAASGYDLKVSFTVNSGSQTKYDGAWQMEDLFDPQQGLRWTAQTPAGYSTTRISSNGQFFAEGTASDVPLRLQEARAALFDPIPQNVYPALIRTSTGILNGIPVTCVLISGSGNAATATPGRRWEETEACIDPQSGLLQVQSQVPGRYYSYDYANAPQFAGHVLPRKVTVTEGGKTVSEISVDSLTALPVADASLFVPTAEMRARGAAVAMATAQKISRFSQRGPFKPGATAQPVCVFGLVSASGKLVEAHSLQPSDPNSQAAVEAAKRIKFARPAQPGARPQQHFVFIVEKFVSSH